MLKGKNPMEMLQRAASERDHETLVRLLIISL